MSFKISRAAYAQMFGPTAGDKIRLADTDLIIEVEKDLTTYGEEVKFGAEELSRHVLARSANKPSDQVAGRSRCKNDAGKKSENSSSGRDCHARTSSLTASVMLEIVSCDT